MAPVLNRGHFLSVSLRLFLVEVVHHTFDFTLNVLERDTCSEIKPFFEEFFMIARKLLCVRTMVPS